MADVVLKISGKVDNEEVSIGLTREDVLSGHSICERNGLEKVTAMKKAEGAALFFTNAANAANAQVRHGFKYAFDIEAKQLKEKAVSILKSEEKKDEKKG